MLICILLILVQNTNSIAFAEGLSGSKTEQTIKLRIIMSNGPWFIVSQHEYGIIGIKAKRWDIQIIPHRLDNGNVIAEVKGHGDNHLIAEMIELNKQSPTKATQSTSLAKFKMETIQVLDIMPAKNMTGTGYSLIRPTCCVNCDGIQLCGCAVDAACGSCCAPNCCSAN